jgi:hypothetical protein
MNIRFQALSRALAVGACIVSLSACSDMSTSQQRTLSGAAIGTGVGAGAAALTGGCVGCGAAIGAAGGAAGGYIYDQNQKNHHH